MSGIKRASFGSVVFAAMSMLLATAATAEEKRQVQGAKLEARLKPEAGFVDTAFAFGGAGSRLLYVHTDAEKTAEIVLYDVLQKTELSRVSLEAVTTSPLRIDFAHDGEHLLVMTDSGDGRMSAATVTMTGKVARKFGPATDIVRTTYDGQDALVLYTRADKKGGGSSHTVEVKSLQSGKSIGKKTTLEIDRDGKDRKLELELKYWTNSYTTAVGIKGGVWDRKEDQRSPDFEGWYDMPTRTFSKRLPIDNVLEHRHKLVKLEPHANRPRTVAIKQDLTGIELVEGGVFKNVALTNPFHHYDPKSLEVQYDSSGTVFFSLTIDPVHPDAAAKKRAVKPWKDLYELPAGSTKAVRRARVLETGKRKLSWQASSTHWAVLPRHIGFERGGPELLLYRLK